MHVDPSATPAAVTGAIRQAARMTGIDFQYLVATAQIESNFRPDAKAKTSSARGLFQFIEQTWLQTLKEQGPALGYGPYADAIARRPSGQYVVTEPRMRGAIMNLRSDPAASAMMAGAFTRANAARLAETLGRPATDGELYIAHFLGSTGASRLIGLSQSRPTAAAAAAFPVAAQANRTIFYDRDGRARSAGEVYRALVGRYQVARAERGAPAAAELPVAVKDTATEGPTAALDKAALADTYALYALATTMTAHGGAPAPRTKASAKSKAAAEVIPVRAPPAVDRAASGTAPAAHATARASAPARDNAPVFHGLFRTTGADEPVAPVVSSLWTTPAQAAAPKPAVEQAVPAAPGSPLDLFQDVRPDVRALFRGRV
jgi:hypothetical protein